MSDSDLKYPNIQAGRSILRKLGIDESSRIDVGDQDFEYTSCRIEELESYIHIYKDKQTTDAEKVVLGCYFLECLNDYIAEHNIAHNLQSRAFEILFEDNALHAEELNYRLVNNDDIEEHCWPIRKELIKWQGI